MAADALLSLTDTNSSPRLAAAEWGRSGWRATSHLDRHISRSRSCPAQRQRPMPIAWRGCRLEARVASALNHPNVCTIHMLGTAEDGQLFIAMEYIEGTTLRKRLTHGPLRTPEVIDIATQIASGLSAAHAAGVVHRDVKPENVMIRSDGLVKVLDFGLAKLDPVNVAGQYAGARSSRPARVQAPWRTCRPSRPAGSRSMPERTSFRWAPSCTKWRPATHPSPAHRPRSCTMAF